MIKTNWTKAQKEPVENLYQTEYILSGYCILSLEWDNVLHTYCTKTIKQSSILL